MTDKFNAIRNLESEQEKVEVDRLDGCDILGVLLVIADHEGYSDILELMDDSPRYVRDIIAISQSNFDRSYAIIREWAILERQICDLDS